MSARQEILNRVRAAHASAPPSAPAYDEVDRTYLKQPTRSMADLLELLVDRLIDYRALVRQCSADDLTSTIAAAISERGVRSLVVPPGLPPEWTGDLVVELRIDEPDGPLSVAELDAVDGVLTGCAVAAAETGTIVLDASPDQGRRAITLVPDYHLCVVARESIVPDVPEMLSRMDPRCPLTMISGPSATSDIELDRVEGVHGPRTLEVIVVASPGDRA